MYSSFLLLLSATALTQVSAQEQEDSNGLVERYCNPLQEKCKEECGDLFRGWNCRVTLQGNVSSVDYECTCATGERDGDKEILEKIQLEDSGTPTTNGTISPTVPPTSTRVSTTPTTGIRKPDVDEENSAVALQGLSGMALLMLAFLVV